METYTTTQTANTTTLKRIAVALSIVGLLAILAAGVFAYLWMGQFRESERLQKSVDASAQEMEAMNMQMKAETETSRVDGKDDPQPAADDDKEQIIEMVGAYAHARVGDENAKLTITISKKQLPFARVSVGSEEGGGYACVLKKSDNVWIVVFCGQGVPMQSELDQWGVPASIAES